MILDSIKSYNPFTLAHMAECGSPDDAGSAGAGFLTRVRDALVESVEDKWTNGTPLADAVEAVRDGEAAHRIADEAPDIHTHARWRQFIDLTAYNEDISEYGEPSDDMTENAGVALYIIANRLVHVLLDEIEENAPQYVATISVPGYLPMDDEPAVFETIAEAWEYLAEERERAEDDAYSSTDELEEFEYSDTVNALHRATGVGTTVYGDPPGYEGDHDLGLAYSVSEYVED